MVVQSGVDASDGPIALTAFTRKHCWRGVGEKLVNPGRARGRPKYLVPTGVLDGCPGDVDTVPRDSLRRESRGLQTVGGLIGCLHTRCIARGIDRGGGIAGKSEVL